MSADYVSFLHLNPADPTEGISRARLGPAADLYDLNGLLGRWAAGHPTEAVRHWDLLRDAVFAGDFKVVRSEEGLKLAAVLLAMGDPIDSPHHARLEDLLPHELPAEQYRTVLPLVEGLLRDGPDAHEDWWRAALRRFERTRAFLNTSHVEVRDEPALRLSVIRSIRPIEDEVALITLTSQPRLLVSSPEGASYLLVKYGRRVVEPELRRFPRVRLEPLVDRLNRAETGGVRWPYPRDDAPFPVIKARRIVTLPAQSDLSADAFADWVRDHLRRGEADPARQTIPHGILFD